MGGGFQNFGFHHSSDPFKEGISGGHAEVLPGRIALIANVNLSPDVFPVWQVMIGSRPSNSPLVGVNNHPQAAKARLRVGSGFSAGFEILVDVSVGTVVTIPAGSVEIYIECTQEAVAGDPTTLGAGIFDVTCVPGTALGVGAYFSQAIPPIPPNTIGQLVPIPAFASDYMFRWNAPIGGFPAGATLPYLSATPGESPAAIQLDAAYIYGGSSVGAPIAMPQPWQPIPARARFVQVFNLDPVTAMAGVVIFKLRV